MKVEWNGTNHEFVKPLLVSKLLEHFSLSRESHLVVVNGKLTTGDCKIDLNDSVRIVRVISGG
jgi:sulfur carrier protein ThiS